MNELALPALSTAAKAWGLDPSELLTKTRGTKSVADARALAIWLVRKRFGFSYPELGRIFSRDHTSCIVAVRKIDQALKTGEPMHLAMIAREAAR